MVANKRHRFSARCANRLNPPLRMIVPEVSKLPICDSQAFRAFVEVTVSGDSKSATRLLSASPHLVKERAARGAIRQDPEENFFDRIKHYIYEGDTALHMAAAAKQTRIVEELISRGAESSCEEQAWRRTASLCRRRRARLAWVGSQCADHDHCETHSGRRRPERY